MPKFEPEAPRRKTNDSDNITTKHKNHLVYKYTTISQRRKKIASQINKTSTRNTSKVSGTKKNQNILSLSGSELVFGIVLFSCDGVRQ